MTGVPLPDPVDVLQQARDYLADPNHWSRGQWKRKLPSGDYAYCASEAITAFSGGSGTRSAQARQRLLAAIEERGFRNSGTPSSRVAAWNDSNYTGHAHVLEVFDAAIQLDASDG